MRLSNKKASRPLSAKELFHLGVSANVRGQLKEAAEYYRQTLILQPDYIEAHYNLGVTLYDLGRLEEAAASFSRAITLQPAYAEAHCNLANIFMTQGRLDEAVGSYRKALSLKPDYTDAHYNLGVSLLARGKTEEAAASFQQALSLEPDFAEAHCNLGIASKELGLMDDAVASFRKALQLKPDYARAYNGLALIVKFRTFDNDIQAMENLYVGKADISTADRIDLGFALGKAYADLEDYDRSFAFILEANRLKRTTYEYSIREEHLFLQRIKKTFSPDFLAAHHGVGSQDKTPIFIVGMPRAGTTLVEQILASHPLVFGAGELEDLRLVINGICVGAAARQFPECVMDLEMDAFNKMGEDYVGRIRDYAEEAGYITDKMPYNFFRVGFIKTVLPNARVIHCTRNPMDNCLSIFKNDFRGTHGYAFDMTELGQYYNLYRDLMAYWEKVLPGFMHTVQYENMVSDQRNQTKSLLDFCGLPWDDACLEFHKTERKVSTASFAQVRQPIYSDSVELWKRYEKQLEPLRKTIYG